VLQESKSPRECSCTLASARGRFGEGGGAWLTRSSNVTPSLFSDELYVFTGKGRRETSEVCRGHKVSDF